MANNKKELVVLGITLAIFGGLAVGGFLFFNQILEIFEILQND